jgi:cytochrome c-type biogenesis protein CcmH
MKIRLLISPQLESETHDISGMVMSPFCPGRSLNDCPSSQATELRGQIYTLLEQGKSKDQVLNELYGQYGDQIRAMPKSEGFGLVGWASPFVFLFLGLTILLVWLKKHRPQELPTQKTTAISSEMKKRIEEEIYGKN